MLNFSAAAAAWRPTVLANDASCYVLDQYPRPVFDCSRSSIYRTEQQAGDVPVLLANFVGAAPVLDVSYRSAAARECEFGRTNLILRLDHS